MDIKVDTEKLNKLVPALARAGFVVSDKKVVGPTLRAALRPMNNAVKRNAPVSSNAQRISLRRKGSTANDYRRGGATRADVRIKLVEGKGGEIVRGLVGVSKSRGKVGWRTHFITRANKNRRVANDFLQRGFDQSIGQVTDGYGDAMLKVVERTIKRNL